MRQRKSEELEEHDESDASTTRKTRKTKEEQIKGKVYQWDDDIKHFF